VRRDDRLFVSLGPGGPLHSFGRHAAMLLGIRGTVPTSAGTAGLAADLAASGATLWLATVEQVAALAALGASVGALAAHLQGVVMPIGAVAELPAASAAAAAFRAAFGIEPVVAYAPPEAGGLIAMNTPPTRAGGSHEVTCKHDTVGRVVNGVVVWPRAAMRPPLGLASLADWGVPDDAGATLVIAATLPGGANLPSDEPRAFRLADRFDVDGDGFLIAR